MCRIHDVDEPAGMFDSDPIAWPPLILDPVQRARQTLIDGDHMRSEPGFLAHEHVELN